MKTIQFLIVAGGLLMPVLANAQLGKLMGEFHGKTCVTVTQLDKNLYGLYKRDKLSPEAEQMLQRLDEVNFLNLNLNECSGGMPELRSGKQGENRGGRQVCQRQFSLLPRVPWNRAAEQRRAGVA